MAAPPDPGPIDLRQARSGSFCWLDLAARDVALAREFYGKLAAEVEAYELVVVPAGTSTRCAFARAKSPT